jgi:Papain family cysteine protease
MPDPWGNLDAFARDVLRERAAAQLSEEQVDARIRRDEQGRVRFRLFAGTDSLGASEALEGEEYALGPPPPTEVTLIDPEDFDYEPEITADDEAAAAPIEDAVAGLREYFAEDPGVADEEQAAAPDSTLPPIVDHRPDQSPIKHQGERATCVSHAALGLLEAAPHVPDDLSEQYAHYKFTEFLGRPHNRDNGLRTTDAASFLARADGRTCLEEEWPYIPQQGTIETLVAAGTYAPPQPAVGDQTYGYLAYKIIGDAGLDGESIKNTRFLESLLALRLNIVIGAWASWDDENNRSVLRPLLDSNGAPIGRGGHAMLVVGYDRPSQYFIVKNSWGPGWGHAGYGYFHYDFVRSCLKYGFTVSAVEPEPAAGHSVSG